MFHTVSIKFVQGILNAARGVNLQPEALLAAIGLDASILENADARISREQYYALWQEIVHQSGDRYIGLHLPEFNVPATWDILGYVINSCTDVAEALSRIVRYSELLHTGIKFFLKTEDNVTQLTSITFGLPQPPVVCVQWGLASIVVAVRRITGLDWVPIQVNFPISTPEDISAYRCLFRALLEFNQPTAEILFDVAFLGQPVLKSDPGLCSILDRYAEDLLARLPRNETLVDRVLQLISEGLRTSNPSLEAIAHRLGYTPRTLQRQLKKAGTSYQELLDQMRQQLSIYYLQERHIAICEVAFLLGFSETSAFYHAFKRWTGTTPGEYRRSVHLSFPA
ncbi:MULTISPECIES: AraC family transcriptional regulator [Nostoc]|uniref:AraC family transcriptional regulator n=3 Tax=Nostoc TaxID=1177 RepID=A0ABR8ILL2_9NOSO|nr:MULTISPECIES: AraC family transcriptional regulator [Nostoc]MBD2566274.1 AraC family transcriptional regulator [Nostoc linckia FACHB-391]MBD2651876.1 AraC family transcriptional regulator [Nostoc foliaceum FACHB-393]